jgi:hypothetical protein
MRPTNGNMRTDTQFSVILANKPALLARICQQLADDKVNILALSMMDSTEHGVLRLVAEDSRRARQSLAVLNVSTHETTVLLATLPNRPGALADVVERLAIHHIGVNYAYCTAGAPGGRSLGVFRVSDVQKATKVLAERQPRRKLATGSVRQPVGARRR